MTRVPHSDLARFDDRYTMRWVRSLPHPVERVWEAVTRAEELNVWLMPVTEIEPRLGGRCRFSWGGPGGSGEDGEVVIFEPPRRVRYGWDESAIEFVLEPEADGTRFTFIQLFSSRARLDAMADQPGGGLPAGPDTPWRPGFVAGFHLAFDELRRFLGRALSRQQIADASARLVEIGNAPGGKSELEESGDNGPWHDLVATYEQVIRDECPRARDALFDRTR